MSTSRPIEISNLGPVGQVRTGRLPRRVVQLLIGLVLFGFSIALMIRGNLGVAPWDVLSVGLTHWLPLSFGQITIALSFVILLLWVPVGERPGVGTLANAIVIGLSVDASLAWLPTPQDWAPRIALMLAGVVLNGIAGAVYIGAQLGRGPRDGLMTGLARRTGRSLRLVRSLIEVVVLAIGLALGGTAGLGTLMFALAIGPLTQFFLPWALVPQRAPASGYKERLSAW
ncbi:MAG: hypothetical protein QM619_17035 [Micropruina sp.]|uniref:membrane protein YczE n=1 Tax=Micropruina sp. TaxID=2737536 RepID=UPI0039E24F6C